MERFFMALLVFIGTAGVARAQGDCETARPPAVGVSVGRSDGAFELDRAAVAAGTSGSVLMRSGLYLAGRGELPIAGPWRARVEGAAARWHVERNTDSLGHVAVRQIVASVGRLAGRAPACGYVLAGGGIYSFNYKGARVRSPGFALTAGIEMPAGRRGAVQVEAQVHMINTRDRYPVSASGVLAGSLSAGWVFRF